MTHTASTHLLEHHIISVHLGPNAVHEPEHDAVDLIELVRERPKGFLLVGKHGLVARLAHEPKNLRHHPRHIDARSRKRVGPRDPGQRDGVARRDLAPLLHHHGLRRGPVLHKEVEEQLDA